MMPMKTIIISTREPRIAELNPARFTLVVPADLPSPAWGEDANALRAKAVQGVHHAIEQLQRSGVAAQGEVVDGNTVAGAREAVNAYRPDEILVASAAATDVTALRAVARGASVDAVIVEGAAR